jgi:hypothetical protein
MPLMAVESDANARGTSSAVTAWTVASGEPG